MAYIDKNMSHKSGSGVPPEVRRISVDSRSTSAKRTGGFSFSKKSSKLFKFFGRRWKQVAAVAAVIVIAWLAYGYVTTKDALNKAANPTQTVQNAKQELVDKVGKLVDLPPGETPSTATVSDASKLQNQAFFARAQNGDKVLVFSKAGRAVLYRPSTNKIIEYSAVNLSTASQP